MLGIKRKVLGKEKKPWGRAGQGFNKPDGKGDGEKKGFYRKALEGGTGKSGVTLRHVQGGIIKWVNLGIQGKKWRSDYQEDRGGTRKS